MCRAVGRCLLLCTGGVALACETCLFFLSLSMLSSSYFPHCYRRHIFPSCPHRQLSSADVISPPSFPPGILSCLARLEHWHHNFPQVHEYNGRVIKTVSRYCISFSNRIGVVKQIDWWSRTQRNGLGKQRA